MTERSSVVVPADCAGIRADRVLAQLSGLSRAAVRRLIEERAVTCGGVPLERSTRLEEGDVVFFPAPKEPEALAPEKLAYAVVFESPEVIVVDKPPGLVVHPGAGNDTGTLANGLVERYPDQVEMGEANRWGLVHRLDRDTSGLLLVARNPETHRFLQAELKERRVERTYVALLHGSLEAATGTVDAPIGRDPERPTRMAVVRGGRPARTHYRRLAEWPDFTLAEIRLETGRTHQIRVHMASIGSGVVGDPTYGRRSTATRSPGRIWLHARRLTFPLPGGGRQTVEAAIPQDLAASLEDLGKPVTGSTEV